MRSRKPFPHRMLDHWEEYRPKFVKVYPNDYRRVIETQARFKEQGLPEDEAIMAAFEENAVRERFSTAQRDEACSRTE